MNAFLWLLCVIFSSLIGCAIGLLIYKIFVFVVEVKRGEWIEDGYNDIPCVCSRCGAEAPYKADCREDYDYDYDDNLIFLGAEIEKEYIKTPYCPYCGADMSGVTDCHE